MKSQTKEEIILKSIPILAREGVHGASMRKIAQAVGIEASVIYSHFSSKQTLLSSVRDAISLYFQKTMPDFSQCDGAQMMLRTMLRYEFDHREEIVAMLQYFMANPEEFPHTDAGYVPERSFMHFTHIIQEGISEGVYTSSNPTFHAKVIAHMVNGFLIEYFDRPLSAVEVSELVENIATYIENGLHSNVEEGAYVYSQT